MTSPAQRDLTRELLRQLRFDDDDRAALGELLTLLHAALGASCWTLAGAARDHAPVAAWLHQRFGPAPGRAAGRLLLRGAGIEVLGLTVDRVGAEREGAVWCVRVFEPRNPQPRLSESTPARTFDRDAFEQRLVAALRTSRHPERLAARLQLAINQHEATT